MTRPRLGSELLPVLLILGCLSGSWFLIVTMHRRAAVQRKAAKAPPAAVVVQTPPPDAPPPAVIPPEPEPEPPPPPPVEDPTRKELARLGATEAEELLAAQAAERKADEAERAGRAAIAEAEQWKKRAGAVRAHVDTLDQRAKDLEQEADALAMERDVLAREREAIKTSLAKAKTRTSFAVLPHRGPNGTWRRPIMLECRNGMVTLQPHGPSFSMIEIEGGFGPRSSPLVVAVVRELLRTQGMSAPDGSPAVPYIFFVIRPDGIRPYYAARGRLEPLGITFGYELVEQDQEIDFPDLDHPDEWDGSAPLPQLPLVVRNETGPRSGGGGASGDNRPSSPRDFRWPSNPAGLAQGAGTFPEPGSTSGAPGPGGDGGLAGANGPPGLGGLGGGTPGGQFPGGGPASGDGGGMFPGGPGSGGGTPGMLPAMGAAGGSSLAMAGQPGGSGLSPGMPSGDGQGGSASGSFGPAGAGGSASGMPAPGGNGPGAFPQGGMGNGSPGLLPPEITGTGTRTGQGGESPPNGMGTGSFGGDPTGTGGGEAGPSGGAAFGGPGTGTAGAGSPGAIGGAGGAPPSNGMGAPGMSPPNPGGSGTGIAPPQGLSAGTPGMPPPSGTAALPGGNPPPSGTFGPPPSGTFGPPPSGANGAPPFTLPADLANLVSGNKLANADAAPPMADVQDLAGSPSGKGGTASDGRRRIDVSSLSPAAGTGDDDSGTGGPPSLNLGDPVGPSDKKSKEKRDVKRSPGMKPPAKVAVAMEIVVACNAEGVLIHPGGYRISTKALTGKDDILARSLKGIVQLRQQVDPLIRPVPSVRFLVEPGGDSTYLKARRQTMLSGIDWPVVLQVADTRVLELFPRGPF